MQISLNKEECKLKNNTKNFLTSQIGKDQKVITTWIDKGVWKKALYIIGEMINRYKPYDK